MVHRTFYHHLEGRIGFNTGFPSTLKMSLGLRSCDISRVSGNLFGFGDGIPDTSIVLMEHGYSPQSLVQDRLQSMLHCLGNTLKTLL